MTAETPAGAHIDDSIRGLRILIVEDEALIAEELRDRLGNHGATIVASVDSADEAVRAALATEPDLILMDIRLRDGGDGIRAAARVRSRLDVPVVYLTAHSDRVTIRRAKETAPFGYVLKPFQDTDLLVAIEMAMSRHALERQLRDSQRRYVETLASIADGVIASDRYGSISYMNPVAEALTQWPLAEASGRPLSSVYRLVKDTPQREPVDLVRDALANRRPVRLDPDMRVSLIARDGGLIPVDDCAAPITDQAGQIRGVVVAFRDIRARRLAEDALERARAELQQAEKMESVGRLAAGIAHDFNNLLTVINGSAELALEAPGVPADVETLLQDIKAAGGRAAGLTRQFLGFARKEVLHPRRLDLSASVSGLEQMFRRLLPEGVRLDIRLHAAPLAVLTDPTHLEQVLLNLVVNARDAVSPAGTITIRTTAETVAGDASSPGGRYAAVSVDDNGIGMDESIKARIFEPYFTTKDAGRGSGLGLAMIHGLVRQSGGFLRVDSEPGVGSSFSVFLPLLEDAAGEPDAPATASPHARPAIGTILVVDENPGVQTLIATLLSREGYEVIQTSSGDEALQFCARHRGGLDVLVTDVTMPGLAGPELASRVREQKPHLRVLFMSPYSPASLSLGPHDAFIGKPFLPAEMSRLVARLLR